jgi:hypothetical protein
MDMADLLAAMFCFPDDTVRAREGEFLMPDYRIRPAYDRCAAIMNLKFINNKSFPGCTINTAAFHLCARGIWQEVYFPSGEACSSGRKIPQNGTRNAN